MMESPKKGELPITALVKGMGAAVGKAINEANDSRDERIIRWVVNNIPGAKEHEDALRHYMNHPD